MELETDQGGEVSRTESGHVPVLEECALKLLNIRPGLTYVDATAGAGGHLRGILRKAGTDSKIIALDKDPIALRGLGHEFSRNANLVNSDFAELRQALEKIGVSTVSGGILADLGVSSMQIDEAARGFSFMKDGPLDMRMDVHQSLTAADLVNNLPENELASIIFNYGEEKASRSIARRIVQSRPITTTGQLAWVVTGAIQTKRTRAQVNRLGRSHSIHPATRTFQALRIAVNNELASLAQLLEQSRYLLLPSARLVIITFHSLEDRLVKQFFRRTASTCICPPRQPVCNCQQKPEFLIITRKPYIADEKEVLANIRSRSAKLRAGEKLP